MNSFFADKKNIYMVVGGVVIIVIAIIIGIVVGRSTSTPSSNTGAPGPAGSAAGAGGPTTGPGSTATWQEVPKDVVIPDQNATATSVPKDVAIPKVSIPAAPGVDSSLRVFTITADGGKFTPSTIAAYTGDTVSVKFTAVDKTYDITFPDYGMKQTAQKGQTKVLEFQAQAVGKFAYYCDSCGGLKSTAVGYIIVAPTTSH